MISEKLAQYFKNIAANSKEDDILSWNQEDLTFSPIKRDTKPQRNIISSQIPQSVMDEMLREMELEAHDYWDLGVLNSHPSINDLKDKEKGMKTKRTYAKVLGFALGFISFCIILRLFTHSLSLWELLLIVIQLTLFVVFIIYFWTNNLQLKFFKIITCSLEKELKQREYDLEKIALQFNSNHLEDLGFQVVIGLYGSFIHFNELKQNLEMDSSLEPTLEFKPSRNQTESAPNDGIYLSIPDSEDQ